ncbi:hypothetical protein ASN18_2762 [Candidatus Magnetominusculus xianensis]|uniref:Calcineurin-like phosphoesterase domain-containing protein n=1 Tax=Candidatus Magnetominusculus xianensis TaxID=1748249 RepID=A0ABR5SDN3_9BACT|nr:hypothetical protein ASN18_2762 [Candidatus Magnetominusculus xianensis]MBF0405582.1 metallophosphoesterase [Nitrospirota bacterium]
MIEDLSNLKSKWFADENNRFVIIPGNHDMHHQDDIPQRRRTAGAYKLAMSSFDNAKLSIWTNEGFFFDIKLFKCKNFSVLICGLESTYLETKSINGIGYITNDQMTLVEKAIKSYVSDENCIKVAVVHHHVVPISNGVDPSKSSIEDNRLVISLTSDARVFLRWLSKNNFSMLIHGHQHESFISMESDFTYSSHQRDIVIAGVGSVSKIKDNKDKTKRSDNCFNYIRLSLEKGIEIKTFKVNGVDFFGFGTTGTDSRSFPLYNHGASVSYNMANILDGIVSDFKSNKLNPTGGETKIIDVTGYFNKNSLTIALREMLIAFGVVKNIDSKYSITYNRNDEIPISFIKSIAHFLRARGDNGFTMFSNWEYSGKQHEDLYSPLMMLSNFERNSYLSGHPIGNIRLNKYTLCAMFARLNDKLSVLLRYHASWCVYLIPTYKETDDPDVYQHFKVRQCFKVKPVKCPIREGYVFKLNDDCKISNIHESLNRTPKPSPSRGELTVHQYDMNFYSLTPKCIEATEDVTICKWFTLDDCKKYKHVKLKEPEKSYQYGKDGIFENNIDLIEFAFKKAEELERNRHLIIPSYSTRKISKKR